MAKKKSQRSNAVTKQTRGKKTAGFKQGKKPQHDRKDKKVFHDDWPKKMEAQNPRNNRNKFNQKNKYPKKSKPEDDSNFEEVNQNIKTASDGFAAPDSESDTGLEKDTRQLVRIQNRKKKKSGGFQSMGLSYPVFKGITRKGYKIPTPIQRKTIPLIMDGKDVVAMARTGSGKTAAFLVPMFEHLKTHLTSGARALMLSPTRELAMQTLKFTKELGKFTGLRSAVILGGDSMDEQFAAIHENPDIIIATPGRFMHVLVEMELKLSSIEYVVFDEADRLFEMGFQEQLREILQRLPESRQTVLFSATLPKLLVDFAKAGLHDPTLIRLDVDSKLSENLRLTFLQCRADDKLSVLLHILRNVVKPSEQTVIFVATKHDVEYLNLILKEAGFSCSYSYSALDQTARKINVAKFRNRKTMILVVTDLAARGIDIPLLDNVINFNFPGKSKLFVHRVGRVARAGSSGVAYSLVANDELPYVLDLHLFLGRPLKQALVGKSYTDTDCLIGRVPQSVIDEEEALIRQWNDLHDIKSMEKVISNAQKNYIKSRPAPSSESIKRMKELNNVKLAYHPMFGSVSDDMEEERANLLESMRSFKPRGTIFEINSSKKNDAFHIMKSKRRYHEDVIHRNITLCQIKNEQEVASDPMETREYERSAESDIKEAFSLVVAPKAPTGDTMFQTKKKKKKRKLPVRDEENYLNYRPKDFNTELGSLRQDKELNPDFFSLKMTSFDRDAASASLDLTGDDATAIRKQRSLVTWDRKRKKYVAETGHEMSSKKVKTESGQWISATYKSNAYKDWLEKSKVAERDEAEGSDGEEHNQQEQRSGQRKPTGSKMEVHGSRRKGFAAGDAPPAMGKRYSGGRKELKRKEQILKERMKKNKTRSFMKHRETIKKKQKQSH